MSGAPMTDDILMRRDGHGVTLSAPLLRIDGPDSLRIPLQLGFSSAQVFDAGLACDEDGRWLLLSRWVEHAQGAGPDEEAPRIAAARTALRDQRASWLALLPGHDAGAPRPARPDPAGDASLEARQRRRMHGMLGAPSP